MGPTILVLSWLTQLDQVLVRITDVNRADLACGACPWHWTQHYRPVLCFQVLNHLLKRYVEHEAQIQGSWGRVLCLGLELGARNMDIDFLVTKAQCRPVGRRRACKESLVFHAQHPGVEVQALVQVAGRKDKVVEVLDHVCAGAGGSMNQLVCVSSC